MAQASFDRNHHFHRLRSHRSSRRSLAASAAASVAVEPPPVLGAPVRILQLAELNADLDQVADLPPFRHPVLDCWGGAFRIGKGFSVAAVGVRQTWVR